MKNTPKGRVVLVSPTGPVRDHSRKALESGHFSVEVVSTLSATVAASPQVVVFEWAALGPLPVTTLRQLRAERPGVSFVALVDKLPQLHVVVEAGVHDFVRLPLVGDELAVRVERLVRPPQLEEPALRELERLPQALASDLSGFASTHLDGECDVPLPADFGDLVVARLPMHLAAQSLEIDVFVVSSRTMLTRLAERLGIPDADTAILEDLARELTNQSAGALKRTCSPAGQQLTMGLPRTLTSAALPSTAWVARISGDDLEFTVVVDLRRRPPTAVAVCELREGMVVVGDLRNVGGTLLLGGGSRLTSTMVSRVRAVLPPEHKVEILDPQLAEAIADAAQ